MQNEIKVMAFDVFGTVVDWRTSIAREVAAFSDQHGLDLDAESFADAWRGQYGPAMARVRSGELLFTKLDALHRMNLDHVLGELGVSDIDEAALTDLNNAWRRLDPWPEVVEGLTRLRTKYALATLSNANVSLMVAMAKYGDLPFDVILGAEIAGHYKPDPETYLSVPRIMDCEPENVLMVATHIADLQAAIACGLKGAYVFRNRELGEREKPQPDASHGFDYIAADFVDLADQLGC